MISRCSGEYFIAFDSRFSSACSAASGSISTGTSAASCDVTVNWLWRNWLSSDCEHAARQLGQVHRLALVAAQARFDLREVEQVVDQPRQLARLAVDDAVVLAARARCSSAGPSSSVSANSWISASGVFRSCDTLDTKFDFISATRTSRAAARGDEEDAEAPSTPSQHRHHRALRPRARRDDVRNRLVAVAGAQPPDLRLVAARAR